MRRRRGSYLLEPAGTFPVIPMIDVMLNLLIFFMLISRYLPPSLNVALPQAASASVDDRPAVAISVDIQGDLVVDGAPADWDALSGLLEGHDPQTQVRIAADRGTDYDYVVRAMDAAGRAGLVHIALETEPTGAGIVPVTSPEVNYD
ncbi:MAG: biopolymer transporter ExbD [bacterium]|nr:biopolymer transporter ExbD [bacterium]